MSFDNLKKIYQFSENSHKEDYWKELFGANDNEWFSHPSTPIKNSDTFPPCDYYLLGSRYYIDIELPGMDVNNVTVHIHNHILHIEGYYQTLLPNCSYLLKERQNKHFLKKISIPTYVDEKNISKIYKNGILQFSFLRNQ